MADQFVETSSQSWFGRLGGSIKGIFVGLIIIVVGAGLLFWGEGRAVKRRQTLNEGAGKVVSLSAPNVDSSNERALVHFSGRASTDETLIDSRFGVEEPGAIALRREVEMFQWVEDSRTEEKKKLGGGTEKVTTYTYNQEWSSRSNSSESFKKPEGHQNPSFPFLSEGWQASRVTVGELTLADGLAAKISESERRSMSAEDLLQVPQALRSELKIADGRFYWGVDSSSPQIGDCRIRFSRVRPADVSVVGLQKGDLIGSYVTQAGGSIALLSYGTKGADEMFSAAQSANTTLSWVLRLAGFVVLMVGFSIVFKPLSVLMDVLPFLGNLMEKGVFLISFVCAAIVWLITVAIGWVFYRPLLGITLLVVAVGGIVWVIRRAKKPSASVAVPPIPAFMPPPPPPPV